MRLCRLFASFTGDHRLEIKKIAAALCKYILKSVFLKSLNVAGPQQSRKHVKRLLRLPKRLIWLLHK